MQVNDGCSFSPSKKVPSTWEYFAMIVRRSNVLDDALRRMQRLIFAPEKPLQV